MTWRVLFLLLIALPVSAAQRNYGPPLSAPGIDGFGVLGPAGTGPVVPPADLTADDGSTTLTADDGATTLTAQ
jgi:hypothetical protein